ncbi:MAG: cob(I)yrinic acid a,c-diamide adenosyltransferase [Clostridium sp.]|nr:cob(I)yrinic acid a,c-diamide adenosyltransferase [Clostridium sp.]
MRHDLVYIYCGDGHGKSTAALGRAVAMAAQGKSVVIISFLKGKGVLSDGYMSRLEPEIKIFHFEKSDMNFDQLDSEKQMEETINIKNGINFAKKVLCTGECDLLVLDEMLGLIDNGIITVDDLKRLLETRDEETEIVLTGNYFNEEICGLADVISKFETIKVKKPE